MVAGRARWAHRPSQPTDHIVERVSATTDGKERTAWVARDRDPAGREPQGSSGRKGDAEKHQVAVQAKMQGRRLDRLLARQDPRARPRVAQAGQQARRPPKTCYGWESVVRRFAPVLGGYPLAKIDQQDVERVISGPVDEGLSASRIWQCHTAPSAILDSAADNHIIARNPAKASRSRASSPHNAASSPRAGLDTRRRRRPALAGPRACRRRLRHALARGMRPAASVHPRRGRSSSSALSTSGGCPRRTGPARPRSPPSSTTRSPSTSCATSAPNPTR